MVQNQQVSEQKNKELETKLDCDVCCESYSIESNKLIQCIYCKSDYKQCQECIKTYLLGLGQLEASCMKCNLEWKYDYLQEILPKKFLKYQYKDYQSQLIQDIEKSKYPEAMKQIENEKLDKQIEKEKNQLQELRIQRHKQLQQYQVNFQECYKKSIVCTNCEYNNNKYTDFTGFCNDCRKCVCKVCFKIKNQKHSEICKVKEFINQDEKMNHARNLDNMTIQIKQTYERFYRLKDQKYEKERDQYQNQSDSKQNESIKQSYLEACPQNECRGYLNDQFICEICETKVCKKCNEIDDCQNHKCKEENIETTKMKKKGSKQCPKCHILIFKVSGCNHFFCTQCKASFDWVTLKPITNNTNPHYYEYMRNNPNLQHRQQVNLCENVQYASDTYGQVLKQLLKYEIFKKNIPLIEEYIRLIDHVEIEIDSFRYNINNINNLDINVKFIKNEKSEIDYKRLLYARVKRAAKCKNYIQILQMYRQAGLIIYTDMLRSGSSMEILKQQVIQLQNLAQTSIQFYKEKQKQFNSEYKSQLLGVQNRTLVF